VNVDAVTVLESIGMLNVAVRALPMFTFVAPLAGTVLVTVGTGGVVVVKLHVKGAASATPPELMTLFEIVAVYAVL
jgi:hypothetical protein